MDLHSIEVAPLAGLVAAPGLAAVAPGAVDADVVAGRHGEAVDHVEAFRIEVVPKARQDMEQRRQQVGAAVKAADESAVAKPVGEIALLVEKRLRLREIAAKEPGGGQCRGQDFRVAEPAMPQPLQCLTDLYRRGILIDVWPFDWVKRAQTSEE